MNHLIGEFDLTRLSPAERLVLAQGLLDSVLAENREPAPPLTDEQITEVRRRVAAAAAGQMARHSRDDVKAELLRSS